MQKDISAINEKIRKNPTEFVLKADREYNEKIERIAEDILAHRHERPIILLSGPSGSGKTTSAMILEKYLDGHDCETHTLSLDNYFKPILGEDKKLLEGGKLDLESPERVDSEFLNEQLRKIIECEPVRLPRYDFRQSDRVFRDEDFVRKDGELVIFEGVHSLNPEVITIPDRECSKIYVSVRTRVSDGDFVLHPSYVRLMRRLIRDSQHRGRSFEHSINMFRSVEEGAEKYIMPFKHRATHDIDTFIPYEVNAYKSFLSDGLRALKGNGDAEKMLRILDFAEPLSEREIPKTSLIREFIGGSDFDYR